MRARHSVTGASCLIGLGSVLTVSAFAQTDRTPRMLAFEHSAVGVVREYVPMDRQMTEEQSLPVNVIAPAVYRRVLETMLARSPTFRQQCRRIANAPFLTVRFHHAAGSLHGAGARTRIQRRPRSTLVATVEIGRLGNPVELIAHEVEHVIEQLDYVDLAKRAAIADSGVQRGAGVDASFETTRAVRVGLKVAEEVRGGG